MDMDFLLSPEFVIAAVFVVLMILPRLLSALTGVIGMTGYFAVLLVLFGVAVGTLGASASNSTAKMIGSESYAVMR